MKKKLFTVAINTIHLLIQVTGEARQQNKCKDQPLIQSAVKDAPAEARTTLDYL